MSKKSFFDPEDVESQQGGSFFNQEDIAQESPPEISAARALVLGAAQGATFGFSDELEAALRTAASTASPDRFGLLAGLDEQVEPPTSYRENVEQARQKYREAQEQRPITFMGGELAGGLAVPVPLTGTLAALRGLPRAARIATQGGIGGAIYGAGVSEADNTQDVALDALAGGAVGGAVGGALGSAVPAIGRGIGKLVETFPLVEDTSKVFSASKETARAARDQIRNVGKQKQEVIKNLKKTGVDSEAIKKIEEQGKLRASIEVLTEPADIVKAESALLTPENLARGFDAPQDEITRLLNLAKDESSARNMSFISQSGLAKAKLDASNEARNFVRKITGVGEKESVPGFVSQKFDDVVDEAVKTGFKAPTEDILGSILVPPGATAGPTSSLSNKIIKSLALDPENIPPELTAKQLKTVRDLVNKELRSTRSDQTFDTLVGVKEQIDTLFNSAVEGTASMTQAKQARVLQSGVDEILPGQGTIRDVRKLNITNKDKAEKTIKDYAESLIENLSKVKDAPGERELLKYKNARETLKRFGDLGMKEAPALIAQLDDLVNRASRLDIQSRVVTTQGIGAQGREVSALMRLGETAKSAGLKAVGVVGEATGKLQGAASPASNLAQRVIDLPSDTLMMLSNRSNNPILKRFFEEAASGDARKRRALSLNLAQQPGLRDMVKDMIPGVLEEDQEE
jgi:hypothetical protein